MCDILVLSAMSLSSGGFSETDELDVSKMKTIDFDVVSRDAFEDLQQKLDEVQKTEADARQNEAMANAKAAEAQKREEDAKAAEKVAREAERIAKTQAEEASAKAEAARQNEEAANAKAAEAQKREEDAKAAEKAAREAERVAKTQAEEAAAQEARAKADAEIARRNEAHAKADASMARHNESEAKSLAAKATSERNSAKADADRLQREIDEIRVRQNALVGNIPQKTIWKMTVLTKEPKGKNKRKKIYSPLLSIGGEGFLFLELPRIDAKNFSEVESVLAHHDGLSVTGELFRIEGNEDWLFVKIPDYSSKMPHIGFGVESLGIDGNRVFYPEEGEFSGKAVECVIDTDGLLTCSSKTENRTLLQQGRREHSVYKGCFLVSGLHGSIGAIVMEGSRLSLNGMLNCEKLKPITLSDLLTIARDNPSTKQKD